MSLFVKLAALIFSVLPFVSLADSTANDALARYQELTIGNPQTEEPLTISVWYPAANDDCDAILCLAKSVRADQAIVLSHGAMGSAREMNWLGYAFASQGFVTIGVNHYGESYLYGMDHVKPQRVLELWRRPAEVSVVLDTLVANHVAAQRLMNTQIDWSNTTAVGFSSGGATVIALAGAIHNPILAKDYCGSEKAKADKGCHFSNQGQSRFAHLPKEFGRSYRDARITSVISLDPAVGPMADVASLKAIGTPMMIIGSVQNDYLPFENHAAFYASHIASSTLMGLDNGEGHFVYVDVCDHAYASNGVSICEDKAGIDRAAVQQQLYPAMFRFLERPVQRSLNDINKAVGL